MEFIVSALPLTLPVPFTNIHIILELVFRAFNDLELFNKLSYKTLQLIEQSQSFDGNPIYAILHEPLYCQGYVAYCFIRSAPKVSTNVAAVQLTGLHFEYYKNMNNSRGHKLRFKGTPPLSSSRERW